MTGSRELERDVNDVEHDGQLCRPLQRSAAMSCVDDKNLNATEVHQELVIIDISEGLLQLQELQQSPCFMSHFWVFRPMNWQLVKVPS